MATKSAPELKEFAADSLEKKVYNYVDSLESYIPIQNDRYRLSFGLIRYLQKDGDTPEVLVKSTKIKLEGISQSEMAKKLSEGIKGFN